MEKHEICKLIIQRIKDYIFSPDCLEAHRGKNSFIRKRKLSMLHLITYLLYTSKASMLSNISSIQEELGNEWFPTLINKLATCEYIADYRNIFITGATGSGKTYMACAFGMEACKQYYTVKYIRLPDLLLELQVARQSGTFANALKKYTSPVLLIIDE